MNVGETFTAVYYRFQQAFGPPLGVQHDLDGFSIAYSLCDKDILRFDHIILITVAFEKAQGPSWPQARVVKVTAVAPKAYAHGFLLAFDRKLGPIGQNMNDVSSFIKGLALNSGGDRSVKKHIPSGGTIEITTQQHPIVPACDTIEVRWNYP